MQRATDAQTAQESLKGKVREDVFSCMGPPRKKSIQDATEIWVYRSGNDYTERLTTTTSARNSHSFGGDGGDILSGLFGFEQRETEKRFCDIHVIFRGDRVVKVNYSGPTGGMMTQDEQCAFATRNCVEKKEMSRDVLGD